MAMGHNEPIKTGDELDCFSPKTKRWMGKRAGKRSKVKRGFNKRIRKAEKMRLKGYLNLIEEKDFELC